jgi:hypothetical protein
MRPEYRLTLRRAWDDGPRACWILLNPSTAEAHPDGKNDPTIRREPIGPDGARSNNAAIRRSVRSADRVIVAWGNHGSHLGRADQVREMLRKMNVDPWCLGATSAGEPKHPLYLRRDTPLVPYPLT